MKKSKLKKLGIPSEFEILNHTITIKEIPDLPELDKYGDYDDGTNEIRLFTHNIADSVIQHSFYHELAHCVLSKTGYVELSSDEKLVDSIGGALAQYHKTNK